MLTTTSEVWQKIKVMTSSKPSKPPPLHHYPVENATLLINILALGSDLINLPLQVQVELHADDAMRQKCIVMAA